MSKADEKSVYFLGELVRTPPIAAESRLEIGTLLGSLQMGHTLGMPHSRPMPSIGPRCHELRVRDARHNWRVVYRIDADALLVVAVFAKGTEKTPKRLIDLSRDRLATYDRATGEAEKLKDRKGKS